MSALLTVEMLVVRPSTVDPNTVQFVGAVPGVPAEAPDAALLRIWLFGA